MNKKFPERRTVTLPASLSITKEEMELHKNSCRWKEFLRWWQEYKKDNYCQDPRIFFKCVNNAIADIDNKINKILKGEK